MTLALVGQAEMLVGAMARHVGVSATAVGAPVRAVAGARAILVDPWGKG